MLVKVNQIGTLPPKRLRAVDRRTAPTPYQCECRSPLRDRGATIARVWPCHKLADTINDRPLARRTVCKKYNQLIRIEESLGTLPSMPGRTTPALNRPGPSHLKAAPAISGRFS